MVHRLLLLFAALALASCGDGEVAPPTPPPDVVADAASDAHAAADADAAADANADADAAADANADADADADAHSDDDAAADAALPPDVDVPPATWSALEPMPAPRAGLVLGFQGGFLYAAAGGPAPVVRLNLAGKTWSQGAPLPTPRNDAGGAVVLGRLYVVGGTTEAGAPTGVVERYNPGDDSWKPVVSNPAPGCCMAAASVGGVLFAFGGRDGSALAQAFDPAQGVWVKRMPMAEGRSWPASAVVGTTVVLVGGAAGEAPGAAVRTSAEVYDTTTDTWTAGPEAPFLRGGAAAAEHGGLVWVTGGIDETGQPTASVWVLDPALGWAQGPPTAAARAFHGAAASPEAIFVAGGRGAGGSAIATVGTLTFP